MAPAASIGFRSGPPKIARPRRHRDQRDVVTEGPDEVLHDVAQRAAADLACGDHTADGTARDSTTSAASMATSVPVPSATPTSAAASTGASLIPSPTKATLSPSARQVQQGPSCPRATGRHGPPDIRAPRRSPRPAPRRRPTAWRRERPARAGRPRPGPHRPWAGRTGRCARDMLAAERRARASRGPAGRRNFDAREPQMLAPSRLDADAADSRRRHRPACSRNPSQGRQAARGPGASATMARASGCSDAASTAAARPEGRSGVVPLAGMQGHHLRAAPRSGFRSCRRR
jgi:hypothetical protein